MRIFLKNEPGIFGIFENMSIGIFKKNEPGIFGNFDMRIFFLNETGIFGIFRNLGMRVFKNESGIFQSFGNFEENYSNKKYNKRN